MARFNAKTSGAKLTANNKLIASSFASAVALVQETLVQGILHARETGDATPLLRTVQAMPKSVRRELAVKFVARYSPVVLLPNSDKGEGRCGLLKEGDKGYVAFNYDGACKAHWTDGAAKADADALSAKAADTMIASLAKRLEKQAENANDNDKKIILSRVASLRALAKLAA
jgi:hypothetical protein